MQRRVLQELRTTPFDPGMWCLAKPGMEFLDQARLAQPRLANDEHQLPIAAPSALPAPHEYRYFLIATDKRRQMPLPRAAAATAGPHQPEQLYRFRHAAVLPKITGPASRLSAAAQSLASKHNRFSTRSMRSRRCPLRSICRCSSTWAIAYRLLMR